MRKIETVIGIHGVPRSGTSWLSQIINSDPNVVFKFQPLFSYAFKDVINEKSNLDEILRFYNEIYDSNDAFLNLRDSKIHKNYPAFELKYENGRILVFKQVHHHYVLPSLMDKDKNLKLILLIRNPLGVLHSWCRAPMEFDPKWNIVEEWQNGEKKNRGLKENYFGFEKWKQVTTLFLDLERKFKDRVRMINYDDLLVDPMTVTASVFKFMGIDQITNQTLAFLKESKERHDDDPNSVFRTKAVDHEWKKGLPSTVIRGVIDDPFFIDVNERFCWKIRN